jgi:hypothetical protein
MISLSGLMGDSIKLGKMDIKLGQVVSNPFVKAFSPVNEGEDDGAQSHEKEGGDHEVHMAHNQLDTIIKAAVELRKKLGDGEKDIPAWIQDHISNAENYISQASSGYYEYNSENINEGNWSKIMMGVRKGSQSGPWTIVIIKDKRVVHQEPVKIKDAIPASYEAMKKKFRGATLSIEDNHGHIVYSEKI